MSEIFYSREWSNHDILDHSTYLNYVKRMLTQFQEQLLSSQTQIKEIRKCLRPNLTPEIEQVIALDRIVNEGFIAAVEYNYKEHMLELEFQQEDPYREHVRILSCISICFTHPTSSSSIF
jgi:hypothetical protein